jgi:uncharacterized protein (TIGR02453 family)
MAFRGFTDETFAFYEGLQADNSRTYWQEHKAMYASAVRGPMDELLAELEAYGPFHIFRPYNDVRFSKGKPPYKENIGAYGESEGGAGFYVALSATSMFAGAGYYDLATDQLERFRQGIDADATGIDLQRRAAEVERRGLTLGSMSELKTAPRGYPKDHPRIALLRRKGLIASREWPVAPWMRTKAVVSRVRDAWDSAEPVVGWLDTHVGPSTLAPEDAERW